MKCSCIKCGKVIESIGEVDSEHPEREMWDGGIVNSIKANYGSEFDNSEFLIAICDKCVNKNRDKIIYLRQYC